MKQRPGTATGICFITLEDETGIANLVVFRPLFEKYRKEIMQARLLMVFGKLQREGEVTHVVVRHVYNMNYLLQNMAAPADEAALASKNNKRKKELTEKLVQGDLFPSRDFK